MRTLLVAGLLFCSLAQAEIPNWVREFATSQHPEYPPATKAVVLLNEEKVTAEASGKRLTQIRKAIKILTPNGRSEATSSIFFDVRNSKVREAKAYVLHQGGKTKEFGRKEFSEESAIPSYAMYSSMKALTAKGADSVDPGAVFAVEFTLEEQSVFSQFWFALQDDLPTLLSRFQVTVPAGWTATAATFNGADAKASVEGDTYTWEARKLPPFEREPSAPGMWAQLPRLGIALQAPKTVTTPVATFADWKDVSVWKCKLSDPQSEVTAAIEEKAKQLTAGKAALDGIRALAEFAQSIRYVAISTNLARGGGYVPHTADSVLKAAYGDCKDKANLLKALLKVAGVEAYMVSVHSGDPRYTQEQFPSPYQFNHAILAIKTSPDVNLPASFTHPQLGRLLLFDPTDQSVPFGFLPDHEQNSLVLLLAGELGGVVRTPSTKPGDNHIDRRWKLQLLAEGGLKGTMEEVATGQEAFDNREELTTFSAERFRKRMEALVSHYIPGAALQSIEPGFDAADNTFRTKIVFETQSYAKIMGGRLWMVRSVPMPFGRTPNVNKATREQPIVLQPASLTEVVEWALPEKTTIDELPDPVKLSGTFGSFTAEWKKENATTVRVERALRLENQLLPAADYKQVRDFFQRFYGAEAAPFVLAAGR